MTYAFGTFLDRSGAEELNIETPYVPDNFAKVYFVKPSISATFSREIFLNSDRLNTGIAKFSLSTT